jgi:hypothetical protein
LAFTLSVRRSPIIYSQFKRKRRKTSLNCLLSSKKNSHRKIPNTKMSSKIFSSNNARLNKDHPSLNTRKTTEDKKLKIKQKNCNRSMTSQWD